MKRNGFLAHVVASLEILWPVAVAVLMWSLLDHLMRPDPRPVPTHPELLRLEELHRRDCEICRDRYRSDLTD